MDRIDRYILRQFILTFFFAVMAFVVIYVAVDVMEHLSIYLDRKLPPMVIVKYYLYAIPDILHLVVPIGVLLASLFTIGRLDTTHELTAIRASGRSMRRVALPLLATGFVISLVMVYFDGWVVPQANKLRFAIDRQYIGGSLGSGSQGGQRNVYLRVSPTVNLLMDYFDPAINEASLVSIERFDVKAPLVTAQIVRSNATDVTMTPDTTPGLRIVERIDAARMGYDTVGHKWILHGGVERNLSDPTLIAAKRFETRDAPPLQITPEELNLSQQNIAELTVEEMKGRIDQEKMGGRDVAKLLVDYYSRFSFPFAATIVIFFGIPFSSNQRKSGAAVQIATTALVSAIYLILTEVSKAFSYQGDLQPIVTVWLVNALFLVIGLFNLWRVERR